AFGGDRVAGGLRVARELQVLLGDMVRCSPDFHVRTVRLVDPGQRIVSAAIAAAHALVLSVSHFIPSLSLRGIAASLELRRRPPSATNTRVGLAAIGRVNLAAL